MSFQARLQPVWGIRPSTDCTRTEPAILSPQSMPEAVVQEVGRGEGQRPPRLPVHCRGNTERNPRVESMRRMLRARELNSVCEEARCPNLAECFARRTVTFMLLGDVCTRACRFCNVPTGLGRAVDSTEPQKVAEAVAELGLRHVVLTSVNRDDLLDQGSGQFVAVLSHLHERAPGVSVEVLTPDFRGETECIDRVIDAAPDVYNHNIETVPRLYGEVRIGARYDRSLALLRRVKQRSSRLAKSGLMLGLGETRDEVLEVMDDLRECGVDCLTLGQYLRPTLRHRPVDRYLDPSEFEELRKSGEERGFLHVASGPLVRSSFRAGAALDRLRSAGVQA
ncbi:MAG: lipoyl synthase [bacterium]|nr:lipoyl synthase [bacterium]